MSDNEGVSVTLDHTNAQSNSSMLPLQEGDSQQAAEAMVQLSGTQSFYQTAEESMEIDPNYDPSDFLGLSNRHLTSEPGVQPGVISSNQYVYQQGSSLDPNFPQFHQQPSQFDDQQVMGNVGDIQQQVQQPQQQQGGVLPPLQSLHKDLAISDSDDEQNNLQMDIFNNANENDDNDDGGDLWF